MYQYFTNKKVNNSFIIDGNDFHHIKNVIKLKLKEHIHIVFNEQKYLCELEIIKESECIAKIISKIDITKNKFKPIINLYCGIIREQKWDYVLQKATELGVNNIYPVIFTRNVVKINSKDEDKKIFRWQSIIDTAAKQTKSIIIPKVGKIIYNFKDIKIDNNYLNIICYENEKNQNLKNILNKNNLVNAINIVIGPEGGFTDNEVTFFVKQNFNSVSLGNNILRAETVPLFVLSCLIYEYDM
ncbi:16S rRNA (uracil1498-N3)-methyltransferase [Spiroplasma corruscae]|uniref:Ribosomal RNA small subunit methyltransferase E n=1 Tax=Spiroplasma corruscae TaxID=216934 RepID=A0A222ENN0_9MOLU|nr:16S rRNA (uracil(1498)-N(3))-methyltransferase [Spiroplasma corruscae]ASP28102.1 16S rRNA (uracil1498-N3)-methyltransferase [Spiroplasma corruscae]